MLGSYTATRGHILKADIKGFFPSVNHDWLLKNVIMEKRILKAFLKAGYLKNCVTHVTGEEFPQGSPVSPPLANLTLNGLEKYFGKDFLTTRYVDDFIVAGKSLEELKNSALPKIRSFLSERGLNLDSDKTSMYSIEQGFDFLGLNFREYPDSNGVKGTNKSIFLI